MESGDNVPPIEGCVTLCGTIKKKKKQDCVQVKVNISRDELDLLEANAISSRTRCRICALDQGVHVLLLGVVSVPFVILLTSLYSFYLGTLTWYNTFNAITEHKNIVKRALYTPLMIFTYPFLIVFVSLALAIYAALVQISWYLNSWLKQLTDLEKGFYGWLCTVLSIEECCPYQVVVLVNVHNANAPVIIQQTEL